MKERVQEGQMEKVQRNKENRARAFSDFKAVAGVVSALFAGLALYVRYSEFDLLVEEDMNLDVISILSGILFALSFQYAR